jgi:HlyD family secretion protein
MRTGRISLLLSLTLLSAACEQPDDERFIVGELMSDRVELTAEAAEPIVDVTVAEGERVESGQLLMRQDATRARARLAEAEATLAEARARFDELVRGPRYEQIAAARANVAGAGDELEFRRSDHARVQQLHARGLASPEQLDRAKAALDAADAALALYRAQLQELLNGTTAEALSQAEQAVNRSEARRDLLQVDVARHDIRAPVDGIVDSRLFELGERPAAGEVVMVVLSGPQAYARIYVPEAVRVHVVPGLEAKILIDGLPEAVNGRVRWVASEATYTPYFALTERDRGRLTYRAKVDITDSIDRLPGGVPVQVELLIDSLQ